MLQPREGCLAWLVGKATAKATAKATPMALKAPCRATLTSFLLTMLVLSLQLIQPGSCSKKMHNIYWNTTNPMFRIDNTDNIIDINSGGNLPTEYDQANIICPRYRRGTRLADIENYIIYNVSRDEYENCRIVNPKPRIIAVCDKPHQLIYFTITFRSFTPTPGGLEFRPGQDYYFISTSSKRDLHRRVGGGCSSHNMKIVFRVAPDTDVTSSKSNVIPPSREQLNRLRQLIKRRRLLKQKLHLSNKQRERLSDKGHRVSPHPVLYYPWREMIRGKTGYSSPGTPQGSTSTAPPACRSALTPVIALIIFWLL